MRAVGEKCIGRGKKKLEGVSQPLQENNTIGESQTPKMWFISLSYVPLYPKYSVVEFDAKNLASVHRCRIKSWRRSFG